ncbi:hypothetical protein ACOMHN_034689 [Nucella lapillus]
MGDAIMDWLKLHSGNSLIVSVKQWMDTCGSVSVPQRLARAPPCPFTHTPRTLSDHHAPSRTHIAHTPHTQ